MKIKTNLTPLLCCMALIQFFPGCKKETSDTGQQNDIQFAIPSSQSDADAEIVFDDVFNNVMGVNEELAFGGTGVFSIVRGRDVEIQSRLTDTLPPCYKVTISRPGLPDLFPVKVVTDFGTGCTGKDGRTRKGKVITVYTGRLAVPGKLAETTFDAYYINDVHVQGTHRIQNSSTSQAYVFNISIQNGKLTKPDSNYSQLNSKKTYTQIEGLGTPLWAKDDIFSIRSETEGTVKTNTVFFKWTSKTIEPLIKNFSCRWIVKGRVTLSKTSTDAAIMDYGTGDCDNQATLIINGITKEITLY